MGKVSYLIKRISKMNYGNMFKTIDKVHEKSGKNKVCTFFDMVYSGLRFGAGYVDYYQFQMYNMKTSEKKTIITRGINNSICKKYNDKTEIYKFEDKAIFNKIFDKYLNRDWMKLDGEEENLKLFVEFCKKHPIIVVKPLDASCGKGVEKLDTKGMDIKSLYHKLIRNKQTLIEEVAEQHKVLNDIYPLSVNTLRVVTLNHKVVTAYLRIGNDGNVVDNFNHGGMVTAVNVETGLIEFPAIDKATKVYEIHPYTNKPIVGTQIPMWEDVKKLCIEASKVVPKVGYVAWDVCLGSKKPCLIEGNDFPGHDLYQLPVHRKGNIGLLPVFKKAMGEK
jgi:glutathione synthase/RimK-type ligase-like ATP-grasp enzyme